MAVIFAIVAGMKYFQLTPSQFFVKAVEKSPIEMPWVAIALSLSQRFTSHILDDQLCAAHPPILLPDLFSKRQALYEKKGI